MITEKNKKFFEKTRNDGTFGYPQVFKQINRVFSHKVETNILQV